MRGADRWVARAHPGGRVGACRCIARWHRRHKRRSGKRSQRSNGGKMRRPTQSERLEHGSAPKSVDSLIVQL